MQTALIPVGLVVLFFIVWCFWPQNYYRPRLAPGEILVKQAPATQVSDGVAKSGRLYLTNARLIFASNTTDAAGRPKIHSNEDLIPTFDNSEWELVSIASVEPFSKPETTIVAWDTPIERMKIQCRDGREFTLAVEARSHNSDWASLIERNSQITATAYRSR